jgi:hypothetical protein
MKDLYRGFLRRTVSPKLLARIRQLTHIDDRMRDVEAARAGLAEAWLRGSHPDLFAPAPSGFPEFSIYSQNGEDGVLLWLIEQTGAGVKTFIEFGVEDARECNTAVLAFVLGWDGLMVEADPVGADAGRRLAQRLLARKHNRVEIRQAFATAENINGVIEEAGFRGEVGVLSIDVDGVDYWLWKAVEAVRPRIVVMEYNASFGAERAVTVPYAADFRCVQGGDSRFYHGASLGALEALGAELGYALVAVESAGVNAFFVRRDLCAGAVVARSAQELYRPHLERTRTVSGERQWEAVRHLPLVDVSSATGRR